MKRKICCVIFDFDGVILESTEVKATALIELFKDYPQLHEKILDYHYLNQGKGRFNKFRWVYKELLKKKYNQKVENELNNTYSQLIATKMEKVPFAKGALKILKELNKNTIPIYIASGTPDKELNAVIKDRKIKKFIKKAYGSDHSKERIIQIIFSKEDLKPKDLLFIGDGPADYTAAKNKNIYFEAFYNSQPDLVKFWKRKNIRPLNNLTDITKNYFWEKV